MFAVIYRFRVVPLDTESFTEAWQQLTELFHKQAGALGSRLYTGKDELWAYAR